MEITMKVKKYFIAMGMVLLMFFVNGCNEKIYYNAVIVSGVYNETFLKKNMTFGAYYKNENYDPENVNDYEYLLDETSPRDRTFIVTEQSQMNDIFESFRAPINLEKQMLVVYIYTDCYQRAQILRTVRLSGDVLKIEFKLKPGKRGYGNACEPYQRTFAVVLDRLDVETVEVDLIR